MMFIPLVENCSKVTEKELFKLVLCDKPTFVRWGGVVFNFAEIVVG